MCHICKEHGNAQDWMRTHHNPKIGIKNLNMMFNVLGTNHIQINPGSKKSHNKPKCGKPKTKELDQDNKKINPTTESE